MTILSLKDASYLAHVDLFKNLTMTFGPGDRVGLVAQNGAGKTTLLRCLADELELSSGEIFRSRGIHMGYMPQEVDPALMDITFRQAVLSVLAPDVQESESWRVDMVLDTFNTPVDIRDLPICKLSGGWQRLMLLARVWISEPDVLLMDEPTNHLDLEKILLLEEWLTTWLGNVPVIVASHDRSFLDSISNRTLFLRPGTSHFFSLSYTRAREELEHIDASKALEQERQLNEAGRLRRQSAKLKNIGINSGSDLLQKKQKHLRERAEKIEQSASTLHNERVGEIKLTNRGTHAKTLIRIENLTVQTPDDRVLFKIEALNILQGERIVILGPNGVGKSTFVQSLYRALIEGAAVPGVQVTPSLVTGFMDQSLSNIPLDQSPFDFISKHGHGDTQTRSSLASAGVHFDWQGKPIAKLSLGQRSRVALLALRYLEPNFYLLDEPTNHIDIAGQEALASEIIERDASCILVSHDRTFVHHVGTRFLIIERGKLIEQDHADDYFRGLSSP